MPSLPELAPQTPYVITYAQQPAKKGRKGGKNKNVPPAPGQQKGF